MGCWSFLFPYLVEWVADHGHFLIWWNGLLFIAISLSSGMGCSSLSFPYLVELVADHCHFLVKWNGLLTIAEARAAFCRFSQLSGGV